MGMNINSFSLKNIILNKNTLIIILFALLIGVSIFGYRYYRSYQTELASKTSLISGLVSDLTTERNKNGSLTATMTSIQSENTDMILQINSQDSTIIQLQDAIKRSKGRNTQLEGVVSAQGILIAQYRDDVSKNKVIGDTVVGDTTYQTYVRNFTLTNQYDDSDSTAWVHGRVLMGISNFELDLSILTKFDVVIGRERKNIFSAWEPYAEITSFNPYDNIETVRSYSKQKMKSKRFGLGASAGVTYLNDKIRPYIGIGVNYNFIEF